MSDREELRQENNKAEIAEIDRKMSRLRVLIFLLIAALVVIVGAMIWSLGVQDGSLAVKNASPSASASPLPGWVGEQRPLPYYSAEKPVSGNTSLPDSPSPTPRYESVETINMTPRSAAAPRSTATPRPTPTKKPQATKNPASDYYHPEDFYEDYYDDFWDYEDAEDYWEEYG